jgi:hypothetical protein
MGFRVHYRVAAKWPIDMALFGMAQLNTPKIFRVQDHPTGAPA